MTHFKAGALDATDAVFGIIVLIIIVALVLNKKSILYRYNPFIPGAINNRVLKNIVLAIGLAAVIVSILGAIFEGRGAGSEGGGEKSVHTNKVSSEPPTPKP